MKTWHVSVLVSVLAVACGPMGPMPGGRISGTLSEPPSDWSGVGEGETVQLETRPTDPYSVNLWGVGLPSGYYVASGSGEDADWAQHIQVDPNVRLRIDETIYELRAARVTDPTERRTFTEALRELYDFEASPEQRERAWVFRLDPR